jgi:putative two-component system response regulator
MYSVEIGKRVGVDATGLSVLKIGGVVHDIGKVLISDHILNKPGRLSEVEMELVKRHPIIGHDILQPLRTFRDVLPIVRWHHEQPNGKGYPDGLQGDQFPLLPRIVAIADRFDALSTHRPYRPPISPSKCREILTTAAENDDIDPSLVAVLFDIQSETSPILVGTS